MALYNNLRQKLTNHLNTGWGEKGETPRHGIIITSNEFKALSVKQRYGREREKMSPDAS